MEEGPGPVNDSFSSHSPSLCSVLGAGDTREQGGLACSPGTQSDGGVRQTDRQRRPASPVPSHPTPPGRPSFPLCGRGRALASLGRNRWG